MTKHSKKPMEENVPPTDLSRNGDGEQGPALPAAAGLPEPAADPFDVERLRLSQDFAAGIGVKKLLTSVPVRKPAKEWFVQTHPSEEYRLVTCVIELKEDREIYIVDSPLWASLVAEATFSPRLLVTTINRQGTVFLWPIRMPGIDGRIDDWNRSALEAVKVAGGSWVRVAANTYLGAYEISLPSAKLPEPEWPTTPFKELLRIAFRDRFIDSIDHMALRKLRGEL